MLEMQNILPNNSLSFGWLVGPVDDPHKNPVLLFNRIIGA